MCKLFLLLLYKLIQVCVKIIHVSTCGNKTTFFMYTHIILLLYYYFTRNISLWAEQMNEWMDKVNALINVYTHTYTCWSRQKGMLVSLRE